MCYKQNVEKSLLQDVPTKNAMQRSTLFAFTASNLYMKMKYGGIRNSVNLMTAKPPDYDSIDECPAEKS